MPTLLIHHAGQTHGLVLDGRLLIGRAAPGGIAIPDSAVSRIHAWIDRAASGFYIADADSRTGTIIDRKKIISRHTLVDGDVITIGPATIHYRDSDVLENDVQVLRTAHSHDVAIAAAGGILFACTCGAPLWAPSNWVGRRGKCAKCGQRTPIPALPNPALTRPQPSPQPHAETQSCSICQWQIEPDESRTRCPTCGLTFHAECWQENKGCSAYGCASVNALVDPQSSGDSFIDQVPSNASAPQANSTADLPDEPFPVEFALLGGSVVGSLVGLIGFGIPALLVAAYAVVFASRKRKAGEAIRTGLISIALVICAVGFIAGLWLSSVKWLHRPMFAPWQHA